VLKRWKREKEKEKKMEKRKIIRKEGGKKKTSLDWTGAAVAVCA